MWTNLFLLFVLAAESFGQNFPKCWTHYGECLDNNQPPLNTTARVKPHENENVIKTVLILKKMEECLRYEDQLITDDKIILVVRVKLR